MLGQGCGSERSGCQRISQTGCGTRSRRVNGDDWRVIDRSKCFVWRSHDDFSIGWMALAALCVYIPVAAKLIAIYLILCVLLDAFSMIIAMF